MNRRIFLISAIFSFMLPAIGFAEEFVEFKPGLIDRALADGKTVFIDYAATWCGTCRTQGRVIKDLRAKNPEYNDAMVFIKVDWDSYKNHEVTLSRDVPRRSTLILLKGEKELGRIVAGTSVDQIQKLMDMGVTASKSKTN